MKRFKGMGIGICALLLTVVLAIGGGSGILALAEEVDFLERDNSTLFSGQIVREVDLGHTFEVPGEDEGDVKVTVKAPNGKIVEPDANEVLADQLGNYVVEVKDTILGRTAYSYNVYCSLSETYDVYVEFNGAKIPTYMATGSHFYVPNVYLGYVEDGEICEYELPEQADEKDINGFEISVVGADALKETDGDGIKITARAHGTMLLRMSTTIGAGKYYTKEYKIFVQEGFKDTTDPRLNVVNVPSTANINTKVTLPIANATDDFDERVFVEIKVTHDDLKTTNNPTGGAVKVTSIDDETGYADPQSATDAAIVFDNGKNMTFYPTKLGTYRVSYQAFDFSGRKSIVHNYAIECTDGLAPIFTNLDEYQIPRNWGLTVAQADADGKAEIIGSAAVRFPMPDVKDNADGIEDLSVSFRIIDPQSRTILRFPNIFNARPEQSESTANGNVAKNTLYRDNAEQTFGVNGFVFDFNDYDISDKTGNYTVEYRASDSKGKTRTYDTITINIVDNFEDTEAPVIEPIDTVKHILVGVNGDKTLTIPKVELSDVKDIQPKVEYTMTFTAIGSGTPSAPQTLDKADVLDITEDAGRFYLTNDEGFNLEIGDGTLSLTCVAIDDVGNESDMQEASIAVYLTENTAQQFRLTTDFGSEKIISRLDPDNAQAYADKIVLGNFKIDGGLDESDEPVLLDTRFAGFEILLKNPNNDTVAVELERMVIDNVIYVKNLSFVSDMVGHHDLYIRVFDVMGNSQVEMFSFYLTGEVENLDPHASQHASAIIPTSGGNLNTRYSIRNVPNESHAHSYGILRVSGNAFSLIGNDFIANEVGTYMFKELYILKSSCDEGADYDYDVADIASGSFGTYSAQIDSVDKPSIEILGPMPTYSEKKSIQTSDRENQDPSDPDIGWVVLPSVSAFNQSANAPVEIKITDKDGQKVNAYKVYVKDGVGGLEYSFKEEAGFDFTNRWAFAPLKDGTYSVEYSAAVNGSEKAFSSHTILVGDIIAPKFSINESARKSYTVGTEYQFFAITGVVVDSDESATDSERFTYTKKLIDPSGKAITVSGNSYDKYAAMKDNNGSKITLTQSGTYTEVYEVTDLNGNKSTVKRDFQVTAKKNTISRSMKMLSAILIIVAVLLLVGVVFYFVRFRAVKRIKK